MATAGLLVVSFSLHSCGLGNALRKGKACSAQLNVRQTPTLANNCGVRSIRKTKQST